MGETSAPAPSFQSWWEKPLTHFSLATLLAAPGDTCSGEEAQQERQAGPAKSSHRQGNYSPSPPPPPLYGTHTFSRQVFQSC